MRKRALYFEDQNPRKRIKVDALDNSLDCGPSSSSFFKRNVDTLEWSNLFFSLPGEIWEWNILPFLFPGDLKNLRETCREFLYIVSRIWKPIFYYDDSLFLLNFLATHKNWPTKIHGIKRPKLEYIPRENMDVLNLKKMTGLRYLHICGGDINIFSSDYFQHIPETLTTLSITCCRDLSNDIFQYIPKSVTKFKISESMIGDLLGLSSFVNLTSFELDSCRNIRSECLKFLPSKLKCLYLKDCTRIDDEGFQYLPPTLKSLHITENTRITGLGIKNIPNSVTELNLSYNTELTDTDLESLSSNIQELYLNNCFKIKNLKLERLPYLRVLRLAYTAVTSDLFDKLPTTLEDLSLLGCYEIEDMTKKRLPPNLKKLNINHCFYDQYEMFRILPSKLESLFIGSSFYIKDEHMGLLPRNMLSLSIFSAALTDKCLPYLPTTLTNLNFSITSISLTGLLEHLPCIRSLGIDPDYHGKLQITQLKEKKRNLIEIHDFCSYILESET